MVSSAQGLAVAGEERHDNRGTPLKNRVWNFFDISSNFVGTFGSQVVELHQENATTSTTIVSGISFWASRDPIEEEGGINLYAYCGNDGVNTVDLLGLSKLVIAAFFDKTTRATISNNGIRLGSDEAKLSSLMNGMIEVLAKCKKMMSDFDVQLWYYFPKVDEAINPPDTKRYLLTTKTFYDYDSRKTADFFNGLNASYGGIKVVFTHADTLVDGDKMRGFVKSGSVLIDLTLASKYTLAHEIGHVINWRDGSENIHSKDLQNLMHSPSPGTNPTVDCTYCRLLKDR